MENTPWPMQRDLIVRIPSECWEGGGGGGGGGGWVRDLEGLYSRNLGQIWILSRNWNFSCGWIFSGGTWKIPVYLKNNEYESQTKKWFQL